jgi:hypothetical protein
MTKILKTTAAAAAIVVAGVFALASTRPDTFEVRRSASINASPERIFPLIEDLRAFNAWNPYMRKDPDIQGRYGGAPKGKGANYAFQGNREVGAGRIEIIESSPPSKVAMHLVMLQPFEASNLVEFALQPSGEATTVTWAMRGGVPYPAKVVHLFIDVDAMVGHDFDAGLANLKAMVENPDMAARTH